MDTLPTSKNIADFTGHVWHSDCLDLLKALPDKSVDLILTDPPYGLNKKSFELKAEDRRDFGSSYSAIRENWDNEAPLDWMDAASRVLKPNGSVLCFGGRESIYKFANHALRLSWRIVNDITFVKPDAPPNFTGRMMTESTERAIWFSPSGSRWTYNRQTAKACNNGVNFRDVWEMLTPKQNRLHPAQKPVETIEMLVALLSQTGDIVLDPFAGSATTAIACLNLDRQYICGDSHLPYVELSRQRIASHDPFVDTPLKNGLVQKSLFASTEGEGA